MLKPTVGIMSSTKSPPDTTFTNDVFPAFCNPTRFPDVIAEREREREIGGESHEENTPIKSIPHHHEKDIIIRPNIAGAAIDRSSPRPRPGGDGFSQRKKERKKELSLSLVNFPTTSSLTKKHPSKERETFSPPPPPPRVQFPSRITDIKGRQNTSEYIKNKYYGRRRLRRQSRTYQSQLHLSVEKEKAEPREEGEERVRDHLSLSLSFSLFLSFSQNNVGVFVGAPPI